MYILHIIILIFGLIDTTEIRWNEINSQFISVVRKKSEIY